MLFTKNGQCVGMVSEVYDTEYYGYVISVSSMREVDDWAPTSNVWDYRTFEDRYTVVCPD